MRNILTIVMKYAVIITNAGTGADIRTALQEMISPYAPRWWALRMFMMR